MNNDEAYLTRADERFICQCAKCGQERLKRKSVCIMAKKQHLIAGSINENYQSGVQTICYLCPSCYTDMLDDMGISEN